MAVNGPTAHFTWAELGNPPAHLRANAAKLARRLEQLRSLRGGGPLPLAGGFRSTERNAAVGGARASQHLQARAADLRSGLVTVVQARAAGFTGIGSKGKWALHVDVRPGPLVEWTYP